MANICRSLRTKIFVSPVLKSQTHIGFIGVKKNGSKISHLGTFKFFDADPDPASKMKKFWSGIIFPDPRHWEDIGFIFNVFKTPTEHGWSYTVSWCLVISFSKTIPQKWLKYYICHRLSSLWIAERLTPFWVCFWPSFRLSILLIVTGYGSRNPIEFGSNPDTSLDPHTLIVTDIQTAQTVKDLDCFIV